MKLALVKSENLDDWYLIQRAEHDGRVWMERTGPNIVSFMVSARFSDADVEGSAQEMLDIAHAIRRRGSESHKRCAVRINGGNAYFKSPRNSTHEGVCTLAEADELALEIEKRLGKPEAPKESVTS